MKRLGILLAALLWAGCANAQSLSFPGPGSPASGGGGGGMVFPLLSAGSSTAPNNASITYGPLFGSTNSAVAYSTSHLVHNVMIPISGTISGLTVRFPTTLTQGSFNIALHKNNTTAAALTCDITTSTTTCSDLVNSVTVAPGDYAGWKITPTGTPTAQTNFQIGAIFTSTANEALITAAAGGNYSTSAAQYVGFGGVMSFNSTRASVETVVPAAGTLDRIWAHSLSSPGANGIWLTVYKNGAATTLQCRLTSLTPCSELTQSVSVVAGDLISLEACPNGSATPPATCTPGAAPTGSPAGASVRWVPAVAGEYIVMANSPTGAVANTTPTYYGIGGGGINAVSTESVTHNIAPNVFTIKNLIVSLLTAPGGSASRAVTLRSGSASVGTPGALSTTITGSATTNTDSTNSYQTTSGNLLNWMASNPVATPTSTVGWRVGAVVTVP